MLRQIEIDVCNGVLLTNKEAQSLLSHIVALQGALLKVHPIVKEAFWDHYSAGNLPGSGYHHRVYKKVSEIFGWRDNAEFKAWEKLVLETHESGAKDGV